MKSEFLIPIIDTVLSANKVLMVALEMLKKALLESLQEQQCEHKQRSDESTSGVKRWRCLECGYIEEKEI